MEGPEEIEARDKSSGCEEKEKEGGVGDDKDNTQYNGKREDLICLY